MKNLLAWRAPAVARAGMFALAGLLAAIPFTARAVTVDDFLARTYTDTNGSIPYRLFVPASYNASSNYPVVLYLHGAGERGTNNRDQLSLETAGLVFVYDANQAVRPCFMVAPQCPPGSDWTNTNIRAMVIGIMNLLPTQYSIDTNRWYVTGLSMGGEGTWYYLVKYPGLFAAGVSTSGGYEAGTFTNIANVPAWEFHATGDNVIPIAIPRASVTTARRGGSKVVFTEYTSAFTHNIWPWAYTNPALQNWTFSQRRGVESVAAPNVRISSPTTSSIYVNSSGATTLSLSGTASDGSTGPTSVSWTNFQNGAVASSGFASGTTSWTISNIAINPNITNFIMVLGIGTSFEPSLGGNTTFNDNLTVIPSQTMGTNLPVITWPSPGPIVYGTALSGTQLNANANVPGTFTYTPSPGTVLNAGSRALSLLFNPTDTVNYTNATATNVITVTTAPLTIRADDKTMPVGGPLPSLTASYTGFVNGDTTASLDTAVTLGTTATISSPLGTYPITPSGAVDANYSITFSNGVLTVVPPPPPILVLTTTNVIFNTFAGSSPANQTVGISNGGSGTLNWTATVGGTGPAWLAVSPTNGSGNGTLTVSVNSSGMASGNYNRTISVDAGGASNSPQTISVSLTIDSTSGAHYDLNYTNRTALLADGWSFLARTAGGAARDTEQTNGAVVSYNVAPGVLRIPADVGDLWQNANSTRNSLFHNLPTNWLSIRLRMAAFAPTQNYQQAGLVAYQDDDTYVEVARIYEDGQKINFAREAGGVAANVNEPGLTTTTNLYLRMDRNPTNNTVTGLYSTDGTNWVTLGSVIQALTNPRLGIIAMASPGGFPNADFAWAEVITDAGPPALSVNTTNVNFTATQGGTNPPNQTITVTNIGGGILNWTNTIGGTGAAWLAVSPTNGSGNATLTLSANTTGLVPGLYNRTLAINAGSVVGSPQTVYVALTVQPPPLVITWSNPASVVYGTALGVTQLNAGANVAGTFGYVPPSGTILNAGNGQTLTANFTPTDTINYSPTSAVVTISILKAPLTITAQNNSKTYGAALPTFTASYSGFVNGDTASNLDTPVNLGTAATPASPIGSYPITASGAADVNYTITHSNGTLTINPAPLTVAANPQAKVYGSSDPALTSQVTAGNLFGSDSLSGSLSRLAGENVGTYAINQGTLSAGTNYTLTFISTNLTITSRLLTVAADNFTRAYGQSNPIFTASYFGFATGENTNQLLGAPALACAADTNSPVAGSPYTITATNGTLNATNYNFAFVNGTLTVTQAHLTITADNQTKLISAPLPLFTATFNGLVNGETAGILDSPVSLGTTATAASPIGSYPITASGATAANYSIIHVDGVLTVANFQLNWVAWNEAGAVTLQIDAPTNIPLVMEISDDLQTWEPVSYTNNHDGTLTIENQGSTNSQRFYRGSVALP